MYPSKQDTAHEMNQKPSPPLPPVPVTGHPVGHFTNQHHNEIHSHPIQHQQQQPGRWSSGLCDCFSDIPNCKFFQMIWISIISNIHFIANTGFLFTLESNLFFL
jgi:hypothetical protein